MEWLCCIAVVVVVVGFLLWAFLDDTISGAIEFLADHAGVILLVLVASGGVAWVAWVIFLR
jgi:hypothetical protein